tara:strand:- start:50 stop:412 length:363 start_codon:yes stop_codon:yes gene_type:complete
MLNKTKKDTSVNIEVKLMMYDEFNSDFDITPEDVIKGIQDQIEEGLITEYEGWELTDKMWEEVTSDVNLDTYRSHEMGYVEYPTVDDYYDVKLDTIETIISNLTHDKSLLSESELILEDE